MYVCSLSFPTTHHVHVMRNLSPTYPLCTLLHDCGLAGLFVLPTNNPWLHHCSLTVPPLTVVLFTGFRNATKCSPGVWICIWIFNISVVVETTPNQGKVMSSMRHDARQDCDFEGLSPNQDENQGRSQSQDQTVYTQGANMLVNIWKSLNEELSDEFWYRGSLLKLAGLLFLAFFTFVLTGQSRPTDRRQTGKQGERWRWHTAKYHKPKSNHSLEQGLSNSWVQPFMLPF